MTILQEALRIETPVTRRSLSSLDSNDSPHQDVLSASALKNSFRQSDTRRPSSLGNISISSSNNAHNRMTTSLRASDRTFVVKRAGSNTSSNTSSTLSGSRVVDREDREEPIYLDEISEILLEKIHQENQKVILKVLGRLADLCSQKEAIRDEACQMGAPAAIVALMKKWSVSKNIQAASFRVLIALTVGEECMKVRKTLWMVGGMEQIIHSMAQFPESRSVQFFGCNALLSLLPSGSEDDHQKIKKWMGRRFVREYKGVKSVIAAMIQFEEDRGIQEAGCSVLLKLATFMHRGQDRKILLESGAVSAFSVALEAHASDEQIQNYTTLFMNFMSGDV